MLLRSSWLATMPPVLRWSKTELIELEPVTAFPSCAISTGIPGSAAPVLTASVNTAPVDGSI